MYKAVTIKAIDNNDLSIVAGLVQDALFPISDASYNKEQSIFVIAINRFIWECVDNKPYQRTHSILHISGVTNVSLLDMNNDGDSMHAILSIIPVFNDTQHNLFISLSGGGVIRLDVESIDIILQDVGESWETVSCPSHHDLAIS